jgi:hypothetical protein
MMDRDAILEQVRTLVADLPLEDRLSIIRSIATIEPAPEDLDREETEKMNAMLAEQEAWFAQPIEERKKYRGRFIAVHQGKVIDQDAEQYPLLQRVRNQYRDRPIPIINGDWDKMPELVIHSTRFVRPDVNDHDSKTKERHDLLWAEQEAWFARPKAHREKYQGEYVAVQNGQVLDHDSDKRELYLRTGQYSKHAPVLLVHADWDSIPEYTFRSPRLVRE